MMSGLPVFLAAAEGGTQSPWFMAGPLVIMMAIFYFMMIRPQQRKEKERREMLSNVKTGERVRVTQSLAANGAGRTAWVSGKVKVLAPGIDTREAGPNNGPRGEDARRSETPRCRWPRKPRTWP